NGKVDRDALRTVDLADERPALTPAGSPTEYALAGIWRDVLGFPVGVDETFEALGGHSLHAVRLAVRIREHLGVEVPLDVFFGAPLTVAGLAARVDARTWPATETAVPLACGAPDGELTAAQRRYWFIGQFVPDQALYNVAVAFTVTGTLDEPALRVALADVVE